MNRPPPLVSVIIPTLQRATLLRQAIRSVLAQTVQDWELLVVDCGSTDGTEGIVRSWGDARIRLLHCPVRGNIAAPRNVGAGAAGGEYLAFLDADDVWFRDRLERGLDRMRSDISFVYGQARVWFDRTTNWKDRVRTWLRREVWPGRPISGRVVETLVRENHIPTSAVLLRRSLFEAAGGFDEAPELVTIEDYHLWLRCACLTEFAADDKSLYWYRIHQSQTSGRRPWNLLYIDALAAFTAWIDRSKGRGFLAGISSGHLRDLVAIRLEERRRIAQGT
jgi:glycosyltransferase involved in cell wall biosynthesis